MALVPERFAHLAVCTRPPPRHVFITRGMATTEKVTISRRDTLRAVAAREAELAIRPVKRKKKTSSVKNTSNSVLSLSLNTKNTADEICPVNCHDLNLSGMYNISPIQKPGKPL